MARYEDEHWVHETDYGEFDAGGLIGGSLALIIGLIWMLINGVRKLWNFFKTRRT